MAKDYSMGEQKFHLVTISGAGAKRPDLGSTIVKIKAHIYGHLIS